ncbi:MAG: redoxin domain-containing protein [Anaerolineales bacterium]|jgi:peroxiredoxin
MDTVIQTGQPAPDFQLPTLQGKILRRSDAGARFLILNFWSAECPWAKRADQELQEYMHAWGDQVAWWSIASNQNEPRELLEKVAAERGLPVVLHDHRQQVADLYGAKTTPHLFVIDDEAILRYQGALDDVTFRRREPSQFYLRQAVESLLAGRQPDPDQTPAYGCTIVRHNPQA